MKLPLPPVYPITDRRLAGTDHAAQVRALASAGARFIQLREKELPDDQLYAEARSALEAAVDAGVTLIINDRVDLAVALKAPGVHLGQSDLTPDSARRLLGPDAIIGFSTHNIGQVREAVKMPIDYLAFGPIFPTSTKEDPDPVTGIELLREVSEIAGPIPVVAIGGITRLNICNVLAAGAASAAIISDLYVDSGPAGAYSELFNAVLRC